MGAVVAWSQDNVTMKTTNSSYCSFNVPLELYPEEAVVDGGVRTPLPSSTIPIYALRRWRGWHPGAWEGSHGVLVSQEKDYFRHGDCSSSN